MNLDYNEEDQNFRLEVRDFLRAELPKNFSHKVISGFRLSREEYVEWHKILYRKGWVAGAWPKEFGGCAWNAVQQYIFEEECALAGTPPLMPFSLKMVAPVIMRFGSQAQQERFLPRILSAEDWWCQGYSEPNSGSDLASVKTRAVREGDHYIVSGQKTWTTYAQFADWIFCLVRTDTSVKAQRGISFFLIDIKSPGVTVRPIIMLDGEHEINEVFFDEVKVPVENRIGEENKGWTYAKFLLGHERTNIAEVGACKRQLNTLKSMAAKTPDGEACLLRNSRFADRIAEAEIELMALEVTMMRVLDQERKNATPGPEASILKVRGSELQQTLSELLMQVAGWYGLPYEPDILLAGLHMPIEQIEEYLPLSGQYLNTRKVTIYGGSNEIQKNIISSSILKL